MDIKAQYEDLLPEIKQLVGDVIDSGRFILGPNVRALEVEVAASVGYGHAVAVANGTDALELGLQALGIGPGDEVVTTAYTFFATAEAIARRGATPVFADIDPVSLCLDPDAAEAAITERTRAVMPVHIFGQTADLRAFRELADRHGIALIEDAAQAFGATFEGYRAGSYGDVATFSFFPTKNFPAMGDAGMAIASSEEIAEKVRLLRFHGSRDKRVFEQIGVNSRLDEMQAVILRRFLPEVDGWNEGRDGGRGQVPRAGAGRARVPARGRSRALAHLPPVRGAHAGPRAAAAAAEGGGGRVGRVLRPAAPPAAGVPAPGLSGGIAARDGGGVPRGAGAADVPDARRGAAARGRERGPRRGLGRGVAV